MPFLKLFQRLFLLLILWVSVATSVVGQSCIYTDRELFFDALKEDMKILLSPDGNTHVWRWGTGRITQDIYSKELRLLQTRIVSRNCEKVFFASFLNCYYLVIIESKTTKLYCITNSEITDRTVEFNKIPMEEMPVSQIRQGEGQWFFIQYGTTENDKQSTMYVTAIDSNLQYVNSMHLTLRYSIAQLRRLRLYTLGNEILLLNTAIDETALKLTVHKLNIISGTVRSNSFWFEDELFVPQEVIPFNVGFILQGQGYQPLLPPRRQTAYTSLLQLDTSLQKIASYSTASIDTTAANNTLNWYLPVSTTVLPGNQLLIADYERTLNSKTKISNTFLRFHQLDSGFALAKNTTQLTQDYSNYPSLIFNNGPQVNIFYEETIRSNINVVHRYQYGAEAETDRLVQLKPKNRYILKNAVRTGPSSFIMPYIRNYKLGVVKVNIPTEE